MGNMLIRWPSAFLILLLPSASIALVVQRASFMRIFKHTYYTTSPLSPLAARPHSTACVNMNSVDVEEICSVMPEVCAHVEADADAVVGSYCISMHASDHTSS